MDTTDTIDGGERAAVITVAWTPPGAEQPIVGMIKPCFQVAAGSRLILSISDVSDPSGGIAPQVVVLDIRNGPAGFVVRDATDDEERDNDPIVECEVPDPPANETERLEDDERRQRARHAVAQWRRSPSPAVACVTGVTSTACFVAAAISTGVFHAVYLAFGVLAAGIAAGAIADAIARTNELPAPGSSPVASKETRS